MKPEVVVGDLTDLQHTFSRRFEARAAEAIARRGRFIVALTGGSVAPALFPALATLPVDWSRVDIFWIDERAVPPDHPDSNYAIASRLLLVPARVPLERIHRMHGELPDLDQAARRAADDLRSVAGDPPHLDLALTGVGVDGHVASIFSGGIGLQPVMPIYDSPKPPPRRLTLTLPVLAGAGLVVIAAFGAAKAPVMRDAVAGNGMTPVAELLRRARASLVLLDREAGLS